MKFSGAPVLWKSNLQREIALSTMEAEYVALSTTLRDFIPKMELIMELCKSLGLDYDKVAKIKSTVWEDNAGCQNLANLEILLMTPRSRH